MKMMESMRHPVNEEIKSNLLKELVISENIRKTQYNIQSFEIYTSTMLRHTTLI